MLNLKPSVGVTFEMGHQAPHRTAYWAGDPYADKRNAGSTRAGEPGHDYDHEPGSAEALGLVLQHDFVTAAEERALVDAADQILGGTPYAEGRGSITGFRKCLSMEGGPGGRGGTKLEPA